MGERLFLIGKLTNVKKYRTLGGKHKVTRTNAAGAVRAQVSPSESNRGKKSREGKRPFFGKGLGEERTKASAVYTDTTNARHFCDVYERSRRSEGAMSGKEEPPKGGLKAALLCMGNFAIKKYLNLTATQQMQNSGLTLSSREFPYMVVCLVF